MTSMMIMMMANTSTDTDLSSDSGRRSNGSPCSSRSSPSSRSSSFGSIAGDEADLDRPPKKSSLSGYWQLDDDAGACHNCKRTFSLFRRRHHCRICGCIFCGSCCFVRCASRDRKLGRSMPALRTCKACFERKVPSRFRARRRDAALESAAAPNSSDADLRRGLRSMLSYDSNRFTWSETMQYGFMPSSMDSLGCISRLVAVDRIDHFLPQATLALVDRSPHRIQVSHQAAVDNMRAFLQRQLKKIRARAADLLGRIEGPGFVVRFVDIVTALARQSAYVLRETSLRPHLTFMSTSTSSPADSFLVRGVAIRKNVVHRRMRRRILSPNIALIDFPIAVHENADALQSLQQVRKHGRSTVRRLAARLLELEPDVIVSSTVIPRLAQDMFRCHDVAVVVQVERDTLEQLARCTGATIINRDLIEQDIDDDPLGRCGKFQVETVSDAERPGDDSSASSLMMFADCPDEQLVTVVLQGEYVANFDDLSATVRDLAALAHLEITLASLISNVCGDYIEDGDDDDDDGGARPFLWLRLEQAGSKTTMCSASRFPVEITLKQFLDGHCFGDVTTTACCTAATCTSGGDHIQVFIRNRQQIRFHAQRLPHDFLDQARIPTRLSQRVSTWIRCTICDRRTSPISVLNGGAEQIPLREFLRPWASGNRSVSYNPTCRHRIFTDHIWFMALGNVLVSIAASGCNRYELRCPWAAPAQCPAQHRQLVADQALSLTKTVNTLVPFITNAIAGLDIDYTTREAMADCVLIRASWFRRKISRFERNHSASPHYVSEFVRLELLGKIVRWAADSILAEAAAFDVAKSRELKPIGFRTIPTRLRASKRRRSIAVVRSRSADSFGEQKVTKPVRALHCHDSFLKALAALMNIGMNLEPGLDHVFVPIVTDDLASHIAHMLATDAHAAFCEASGEGSRPDDAEPHFQHVVMVASIETRIKFKAMFAVQFRLLRQHVYRLSDRQFIASLTACSPWHDHGGKSRARFFMTADKRLILKSLTERQFKILVANTASYLAYMQQQNGRSCLVPILGVYRLEYTKTTPPSISTFLFSRMRNEVVHLIVMPNILYGMTIAAEFDLKGASPDAQESALFAYTNGLPLAIRSDQFSRFVQGLTQDTEFLVQQQAPGSVDYSLLVGIDQAREHLAIGVIDYISQYTLERKLESRLKTAQASLFGMQSPTVISPVEYRDRLLSAIPRYFIDVD